MTFDPSRYYATLGTRDRRFDGRFYIAVRTTGVYCRPICPARTPRRENVTFYPSPAAAEEAGYRPCRRCRPETAPASPAWQGTSATVTRALRLLACEKQAPTVAALAVRLGVGERHLRRLFGEHVGASPRTVRMSRRTHFARRLLDETELPLEDVALAAGFGSARRLRAALTATFGASARALRGPRAARPGRSAPRRARAAGLAAPITLRLPYVGPYDWAGMLAYRSERALGGVETVAEGAYRRTIDTPAGPGLLEVRRDAGDTRKTRPDALTLALWLPDVRDLFGLVDRARRMLDLDTDAAAIDGHLGKDRALARRVARRPGVRIPAAWDPFELAVRAVLGQQVSVAAASTVAARLVAAFGTPMPEAGALGLTHRFPDASTLAAAPLDRLCALGLNGARARAVLEIARAVRDGRVVFDATGDAEAVVESLTALPGIGPWTAHYVALRGLGEPDAFPAGDLGLRKALAGPGKPPLAEKELARRAEAWRPWRGYAALHLWGGER
jgi:AraC family transcriptional regulator of adaptative response / DNA-3-methyladenine glycosylase II